MFIYMSSDNSTDGISTDDNSTCDGSGEQETFHIYILSFAYGL